MSRKHLPDSIRMFLESASSQGLNEVLEQCSIQHNGQTLLIEGKNNVAETLWSQWLLLGTYALNTLHPETVIEIIGNSIRYQIPIQFFHDLVQSNRQEALFLNEITKQFPFWAIGSHNNRVIYSSYRVPEFSASIDPKRWLNCDITPFWRTSGDKPGNLPHQIQFLNQCEANGINHLSNVSFTLKTAKLEPFQYHPLPSEHTIEANFEIFFIKEFFEIPCRLIILKCS